MTNKARSYIRTGIKAVGWQAIGFVMLYALTGSLELSAAYIALRFVLYFVYHRLWKLIHWGAGHT